MTASQGGATGGYHAAGRQFGKGLLGYEPYELEPDEWLTLVDRMDKQFFRGHPVDREGIEGWLRRHFPRMMQLVPRKRVGAFLDGFIESHEEGEMLEDFPPDFEPVEVNLDDPCNGVGYIRASYHRPHGRMVVYQCPAPSCREASRAAVEEYAKTNGLAVVDQGATIAAVQDLPAATAPSVQ